MDHRASAGRPRTLAVVGPALALALACATDQVEEETSGEVPGPVGPAEVVPLCGSAAPLRLLALAEGERLLGAEDLARIGDRYYITVTSGDRTSDPRRTYSVGLCGEDRRVIADDLNGAPFPLAPWPDGLFACRDVMHYGRCELVALDPGGASEPITLIPVTSSLSSPWPVAVDDGLVTYEGWPDDPGASLNHYRRAAGDAIGLEDGVPLVGALDFAILHDEVFVVDYDDRALLRVDLTDGSTSVEASSAFDVTASATHLLYRTLGDASGVFLRERATGVETLLAECQSALYLDAGTARVSCDNDEGGTIVDLGSGAQVIYGPGRRVNRQIDDGRWLLDIDYTPGVLVDVKSGVETELAVPAGFTVAEADAALIWPSDGSLLSLPYDGAPAETIARRASRDALRLHDGRVVTDVELDDGTKGLVVVERGSLDERLIDRAVTFFSDGHLDFPYVPRPPGATLDPDVIAYQVDDGERSGIYLVALGAGGG